MERNNLNQAHLRAKKKRIDNTTVDELLPYHLRENKTELIASLHDDNYKTTPVKWVKIPNLNGGVRKLGILTVVV
ncbi:hypothetical protein [Limosilactobacillus reuteri]|uniref:Uncharacterized protein n=1 Tax=Limosilactobacillus reuteri TaxID=1598 RepID=A0A3M6SD91_LIMRT|nr:hypothetical protein [Limosilactobacillus reuteri]QQR14124.1 hypothetical protein I5Q80_06680 [Limosilactobacillus reuteri]RMX25399.1 hypothetical protein C5O77_04225 [Limosilactobacillus reuteri]